MGGKLSFAQQPLIINYISRKDSYKQMANIREWREKLRRMIAIKELFLDSVKKDYDP